MPIRIGIIRSSSIGDVVLATACLDYLQRRVPEAQVVWVGRKPTLSLLQMAWPKLELVELRSGASRNERRQVFNSLFSCDLIIDLQTSLLTRYLIFRLRRRGKRVFAAKKAKLNRLRLVFWAFMRGRIWQLPSAVTTIAKFQYQMMLDPLDLALRSCGLLLPSQQLLSAECRPKLELAVSGGREDSWRRDMSFGNWIAIACGASHRPKQAPLGVFKDILVHLLELLSSDKNRRVGLVFVGSADDRQPAIDLIDALSWDGPVLNLAGKLTIEQSASLLSNANVLLSNDSGLAHIAEAVGVPAVVLFGPTVEAFGFAPWRKESRAYSAQLGCRPCSRHGKRPCRFGDSLCFQGIDARAVSRHLLQIIGGTP